MKKLLMIGTILATMYATQANAQVQIVIPLTPQVQCGSYVMVPNGPYMTQVFVPCGYYYSGGYLYLGNRGGYYERDYHEGYHGHGGRRR